jgi:hypothetical protein
MLTSSEFTIIGHLPEGDTLMHTLYRIRMSMGEGEFTKTEVVSFKPYERSWRVLLTGELEGMIAALRKMLDS